MSAYGMRPQPIVSDLPLFRRADPHRLPVRAEGPPTSREAAVEHVASGANARDRLAVYEAVAQHPGRTALELDKQILHADRMAGRRLSELRAQGLVAEGAPRRCEVSGRRSITWWPKTA